MGKTVIIIQARMGSTRLPGKILRPICGKEMLWHIVSRARCAECADDVVLATTTEKCDDIVAEFCSVNNIECFRGSECNVLKRYYACAKLYSADTVVRLTCDNPLIDPGIIDEAITAFKASVKLDYLKYRVGLPLGFAVEVFSMTALEKAYSLAKLPSHFEHVTYIMYTDSKNFSSATAPQQGIDYSRLRWTVDTPEDYQLAQEIYACLYAKNPKFGFCDIINEYETHPQWRLINSEIEQKQA